MKPLHIFFAIAVSAIWGVNFVITKAGLQDIDPIFFTCLRYTAIAFPLIFFIKRDGLPLKIILQIGLFLGTFTFTLAFIGIKLGVPAGLTSLLMQSQIIFTLIFSTIFLKDLPTKIQTIGVAISALGVGFLIWGFIGSPTFTGFMFVMAGAVCSGAVKIFMKRAGNINTFRLMVWMSLIPPIPLLIVSLMFESGQWDSLINITYAGAGAVLFNAFISTILGFGLIGYLVKLYSPNQVAPYAFLVPVFGIAAGYVFLGETLNTNTIIACCIIMTGLLYPTITANLRAKK
ncbi:MAG: EamA family transporter [Proteobacteria bacterium]|nr:EamA family transporter [Pseudomonadota bacterium]